MAPTVLKTAPWAMSVPIATVGLNPNAITSSGVMSEPPPIPVRPTRPPISRPERESFQSISAPSGDALPPPAVKSKPGKDAGSLRTGQVRGRLRTPPGAVFAAAGGDDGHCLEGHSSIAVRVDQHLGHLRPGELDRGELSGCEQLADLRPGEEDVSVAAVWACLRRRHLTAHSAVERVLEEHRLDVELVRLELVEDQLRVVGAVVVADAGVVAPDDEVRAPVVLPADRVPDRLPGPGVAHRSRKRRQDDAVGGVVLVEQ